MPPAAAAEHEAFIAGSARTIESLRPHLFQLLTDDRLAPIIARAEERGYFEPDEEAALIDAFSIMLTARAALLELTDEVRHRLEANDDARDAGQHLRCFAIGYAAACMLVCAARHLVGELAAGRITQRKLNEGCAAHRVPRKQFTRIYRSLTNPLNAWRLMDAMRIADAHRSQLDALRADAGITDVIRAIDEYEERIRVDKRTYLRARLRYRWHSWRRRRASGAQQALFHIAEASGRMISEMRLNKPPHVTPRIRRALGELLRPGDVIVTRHQHAMSNLFLPGFWPHVALHIGPASTRDDWKVKADPDRSSRWIDPVRILEAKKDGVLLRPLKETLRVDAVAVLRPLLDPPDIAAGIGRALEHEGKMYNFDFDFFRSDRLVCTEVVYRGFHGLGPIDFQLTTRSGRPTLSAEDLIAHALDRRGYEPVAVYNAPTCRRTLITDDTITDHLRASIAKSGS